MIFSKNKKLIAIGTIFFIIIILIIGELGSNTIKRRKQMNEAKSTIIDEATNEVGNMTGDMLRIKNKILDNTLEEESVMSGNASICANIFGEISYMKMILYI